MELVTIVIFMLRIYIDNCIKSMAKILLLILIVLHGAIHLLGFVKAYHPTSSVLPVNISKVQGVLWLVATALFLFGALLLIIKNDNWWILLGLATVISQYLVILTWKTAAFGTVANILILFAVVIGGATSLYRQNYERDVAHYFKNTIADKTDLLTEADILHLPEPVKRYLRYVGCINKPKVKNFRVTFVGRLRQNASSEWMPFASEQYNFLDHPARLFFLNATMKHLPVSGYHCYKDSKASMDIRLLSMFRVQYQSGPEMDTSETVTYFNDMCCMAPATLIDKHIIWQAVNDNAVKAFFTNPANNITIAAWLYFNNQGQLINFISEDRYANTDAGLRKYRWATPLKNYKEFNGYRLASYADAIYTYPDGDFCYGQFTSGSIAYNVQ
jgi:hypothetical protein